MKPTVIKLVAIDGNYYDIVNDGDGFSQINPKWVDDWKAEGIDVQITEYENFDDARIYRYLGKGRANVN